MPEWSEEAVILGVRPHGETSAVITVFAPGQGRHAGLVRGGSQPKMRSALQPGSRVQASWRARLAETLGYMTIEPVRSTAALVLDDGLRLAGLASICALLDGCLAEREAQPALYAATRSLLDLVCIEDAQHRWIEGYVRWEVGLLQCIGYSLDLERCAVTGATEGLVHVSPKSGRAVSRGAAGKFADRMLLLPAFLGGAPDGIDAAASGADGTASGDVAAGDTQGAGEGAAAASGGATGGATAGDHASAGDVTGPDGGKPDGGATPCKSGGTSARHDFELGLALTGYFFENRVFASLNRDIPAQRRRFAEKVSGLFGGERV